VAFLAFVHLALFLALSLSPGNSLVSSGRYQKGKTNLDFTEARDSEWQWHQLGHMQVCTSLLATTPPFSFLQAGCPSCRPTNSVKALKAIMIRKVNESKYLDRINNAHRIFNSERNHENSQ